MSEALLASIIVNNYNYSRFLRDSIDSALGQGYSKSEVIVVDDGSTDSSRAIIESYRERVIPVMKANGGQASALNAGFAASRGEVVLFLDSDDLYVPSTLDTVVPLFLETGIVKVHWPLRVIDAVGRESGQVVPAGELPEGSFGEAVLERGPASSLSPPTSGNAWARDFLQRVMPIPEHLSYYRICADEYLCVLAPILGAVRAIREPQGFYRVHGRSIYSARSFDSKLQLELEGHEQQCVALAATLRQLGIQADVEGWRQASWFHRLEKAVQEIRSFVPTDSQFILVDDEMLDAREAFLPAVAVPFLERQGKYWGRPEDDVVAIRELERLRAGGVSFMVFTWPAFWWLDHYGDLCQYLCRHYKVVLANDRVKVFDLRWEVASGGRAEAREATVGR